MSRLMKVDHVSFVVDHETICKRAWFYLEVMGG
jgi:hypothetical protein